MARHVNVFISSTYEDLIEYREAVSDVVLRLGMHPIAMEHFGAATHSTVQESYANLQKAEAFVGIYAHRYGSIPKAGLTYDSRACDGERSITEMEYHWAVEKGIPLCLFVVHKDVKWTPAHIDSGTNAEKLTAFLDYLKNDNHTLDSFTTPDNLGMLVGTALQKVAAEIGFNVPLEGWRTLRAPPPPTYFTGRAADIEAIRTLLAPDGARVVVQGVGGVGKTALAKFLGRALAADYPGGVLWAELGPTAASADLVLPRIWADWKAVTPAGRAADPAEIKPEQMRAWLQEAPRPLLAIVDDVWHPEPLRALLDVLPSSCDALTTTRDAALARIPFGVRYELKQLTPEDALALLVMRLGAGDEHREILAELAQLLGYHALALALAAARLETTSLHDAPRLIGRLQRHREGDNPFKELKVGDERDEDLEKALSLSYQPLDAKHQLAFRLLGIIPPGLDFDRTLALAIWGVDLEDETACEAAEDRLDRLTHAALVARTPTGRYWLHQNLGAYAHALLRRAGDEEDLPAAARYHAVLLHITRQFQDLPPEEWKVNLSADYPHLHARADMLTEAVEAWLASQGVAETEIAAYAGPEPLPLPELEEEGRALLGAVLSFVGVGLSHYVLRRHLGEQGRRWLRLGLLAARGLGERTAEGLFLNELGAWHSNRGYLREALAYYQTQLPIVRDLGDRVNEAQTLNNIGAVYNALGERARALEHYQLALSLRQEVGDRTGEATTLNNIGTVYRRLGENERALACYEQALPLWRAVGDRAGEAATLSNTGTVYYVLGEEERALEYFEQALPLRRAVGDRAGEAQTLSNIGGIYSEFGEWKRALEQYEQALLLRRAVGDRAGEAITLTGIGAVYDALGEREWALEHFEQALPLTQTVGDRYAQAFTLYNMSFLVGREEAIELAERARELFAAVQSPDVRHAEARLAALRGE